jgi:gas vesicle protein
MNNNRCFEFLTGFVVGGVVGAVTVLLMAPASGEETREQIRVRSSELKNRGEELGNEAKVQVQKATKEGQKRVSDVQERTGLALEEQKARLAEAIDAGKQAASQRKDELVNRFEDNKAPKVPAQA